MDEVAVRTDTFPMVTEDTNEAVPYKVIETKDAYEIRDYEEGRRFHAHALSRPAGLLPCEQCEKDKLLCSALDSAESRPPRSASIWYDTMGNFMRAAHEGCQNSTAKLSDSSLSI